MNYTFIFGFLSSGVLHAVAGILSSMLQQCQGSITVLLDTGTQKARILNIGAVEKSDSIYFLYIIIQGIQIFGLCEPRAGVYLLPGWDFLHLGRQAGPCLGGLCRNTCMVPMKKVPTALVH